METRTLGRGGPELTVIGFGAWAIGGPWLYGWGAVDDEASAAAIRKALDLGINWIDTAAVYGLGHSEEVVGKSIAGIRDEVFLATKCGMVWDDRRNVKIHLGPKSIRKEVEDSLKRLRTDYIDLYQFHWPDPETPVEESWQVMTELRKEGKVKYIGVCNFNVPLLSRCSSIAPVQSLQPPYSLVMQEVAAEILPYCLQNGIGVIAYSPMMSGLLTGKFDMRRLAEDDWRRRDKKFQEPLLSKELALVEELRPIAAKYDKSVGNLAVAWVNMNSAVTSSIVGARTDRQVEENVGSDFRIDEADMRMIEQLYKETVG